MSKGNYNHKKTKRNQQANKKEKTERQPTKMKFNIFFALILFIGAASLIFFGIQSAFYMGVSGLDLIVGSILLSSFCISTGVFLLKKKKLGYKLAILYNWLQIIGAISSLVVGILIVCSETFLIYMWYILGYASGAFMIMSSIPVILLHIFAIIYFKKRKNLFV